MDHVLDRDGAHRAIEGLVTERQARLAVDVVHDGLRQLRVLGHLLGVQSQPDDLARGGTGRQVAAPATHQIQEGAARRQHLGVQSPERGDRPVVDVDNLARERIEAIVRRVVVPLEGRGRKHAVAPEGLGPHAAPVNVPRTPRASARPSGSDARPASRPNFIQPLRT